MWYLKQLVIKELNTTLCNVDLQGMPVGSIVIWGEKPLAGNVVVLLC